MTPAAILAVLIPLAAAPAAAPSPAVTDLHELLSLAETGASTEAMVAAVRASGVAFELDAERAVRLHFAGLPAPVIAAVFATSGKAYPRVSARPGEIELLYDGFRIVGRRGAQGEPLLTVSGYGDGGERLKPGVERAEREPAPPVAQAAEASREDRLIDALIRQLDADAPAPAAAAAPVTININNPPAAAEPYENVYYASPWRYSDVEVPRRHLEPSVGFSWTDYVPLSWPSFSGRPGWRIDRPAPPAASAPEAASAGDAPAPAPRVVTDRIRR